MVRVSVNCGAGAGVPLITEDIGNMTVALGREATLKCVVTQLSDYKVQAAHWSPPATSDHMAVTNFEQTASNTRGLIYKL